MYRDLRITGFRGFKDFSMGGLGRVNLLVGENNCGKTSVLEAICMLRFGADPLPLAWMIDRRELVADPSVSRLYAAVAPLFHGHSYEVGSRFSITVSSEGTPETLSAEVLPRSSAAPTNGRRGSGWLEFTHHHGSVTKTRLMISPKGSWFLDPAETDESFLVTGLKFLFDTFEPKSLIMQMLGWLTLNPEERFVIEALRIVAPELEGIALGHSSATEGTATTKEGIFIKLRGQERRIPLSSLGEGTWRLLSLALSLVSIPGGVLLIDDIDTGLHYSVMVRMWKMVLETARRLNVQVFATTHSRDCVEALAQLARPEVTEGGEISLQRIERDKAVAYSESAIVAAAERGIEVR